MTEVRQENGLIRPSGFGAIIFTKGKGTVICNDVVYQVEPDVILAINPFSIIRLGEDIDSLEGILVEVDVNTTMTLFSDVAVEKRLSILRFPCVRITDWQRSFILRLLDIIKEKEDSIKDSPKRNEAMDEKILTLLTQSLCLQIQKIFIDSVRVISEPAKRNLLIYNKFISSLYSNCHSQRTVTFYARQQNMSTGRFAAVVKEVSGQSPKYWIEIFTMTKIRGLLSDPGLTIKEVMDRMNFPDQSTFGRYFKQREGLTPAGFKERHSSAAPPVDSISDEDH